MKKRTMKKLTSVLLTCLMVMGTFCVGYASGESTSEPLTQTITVCDDTFVHPNEKDINKNSETALTFNENRDTLLRFNLNQLEVPAGYEIASAKVSVYINDIWKLTNGEGPYPLLLHKLSTSIYDPDKITYNNFGTYTKRGDEVASVDFVNTLKKDDGSYKEGGTISQWVEFAINDSDYLNSQLETEKYIAFSFRPKTSGVNGGIHSLENSSGNAAKLTITFKEITGATIYASDSADVNADGTAVSTSDISIQDNGNNKYDSSAYFKFDLSKLAVAPTKVIKSAKLKLYFTSNYNKKNNAVRIYNIDDNSWSSSSISWENKPELPADNYSGSAVVPYGSSATVNQYIEFDVTAYVSSRYAANAYAVSFAAWSDILRGDGVLYLKGHTADKANQPMLVIELGDETEFTFGTPQFYSSNFSNENPASTLKFVVIPAFGASKEPISTSLFVAQYDSETNKLEKVEKKDVTLYSSNGDSAYITSMYVKDITNYYVKAFLLTDKLVPLTESNGTITYPVQ